MRLLRTDAGEYVDTNGSTPISPKAGRVFSPILRRDRTGCAMRHGRNT